MLKAVPLAHFSSGLLLEYVRLSLLKTLNTLVKSMQNQLISSKICPENSHEISCFSWLFFSKVSRENFCEICLWKSHEILLPRPIRSPVVIVRSIRFDCLKILWTENGINLQINWLCLCDLSHFVWRMQSKKRLNVCFNFTLLSIS